MKSASSDLLSQALSVHESGDLKRAKTLYNKVLSSDPKNVVALNFLGVLNCRKDNLEEGVRLMKMAVSIQPQYADPYYNLGVATFHMGKYQEALTYFDKTLTFAPDARAYWNKSML